MIEAISPRQFARAVGRGDQGPALRVESPRAWTERGFSQNPRCTLACGASAVWGTRRPAFASGRVVSGCGRCGATVYRQRDTSRVIAAQFKSRMHPAAPAQLRSADREAAPAAAEILRSRAMRRLQRPPVRFLRMTVCVWLRTGVAIRVATRARVRVILSAPPSLCRHSRCARLCHSERAAITSQSRALCA